jgi:hypothetical protein
VVEAEPPRQCDGGEHGDSEQAGEEAEPEDVADGEIDARLGVAEAGDPAQEEQGDVDEGDGWQEGSGSKHQFSSKDEVGIVRRRR